MSLVSINIGPLLCSVPGVNRKMGRARVTPLAPPMAPDTGDSHGWILLQMPINLVSGGKNSNTFGKSILFFNSNGQ